jgi:RNA methyltransferase, TrmH family
MDITSAQNSRVKHIVKLREDRRQREQDGLMLVEGRDEIAFALSAGLRPQAVFTAPELADRQIDALASETITVNRAVFEKMAYRENPDGWLAVFPIPRRELADLALGAAPLVLIAESLEKPGNLGAILRTADAAGVDAVLVVDPRVDLWNPNVVRASRGAVFTVPAVQVASAAALAWLRQQGIRLVAATPAGKQLFSVADLRTGVAIAVGTEDEGLSHFWLEAADERLLIPMRGKVNSLNVSIAAAVLLYEAVRQRAG